jgi:hypothetical protein
MPHVLKNLSITEVSSVTSGANSDARILLLKSAETQERKPLPMLDDLVMREMELSKIDAPHAFSKVMGTIAGAAAYRRETDWRLMKAANPALVAKNDEGGEGGLPLDSRQRGAVDVDSDSIESLTQEHMRTCRFCNSKSVAHTHLVRTSPKARALLAAERRKTLAANS